MTLSITFTQDELFEVEEALRVHISDIEKKLSSCNDEKMNETFSNSLQDLRNAHFRVEQVLCSGSHAPLNNS